jgi:uncharacterized protein YerC
MVLTLAERIGIKEKINKVKEKGGKLSEFEKFGIIKTEGSSKEIHEWIDSFVPPFTKEELEKYYQNPELFLQYGQKNMELFLEICEILKEYATVVLSENFSKKERGTALLMGLHLVFTASDMFYKHDRFLEISSPEISPFGKVYNEISKIIEKVAKLKKYDEKWKNEKLFILLTMPSFTSLRVRLFLDCSTILKKYSLFEKLKSLRKREEIMVLIRKDSQICKEIEELSNKYKITSEVIIDILSILSPEDFRNIEEHLKKSLEKVNETFNELKIVLGTEDYKKLKENYEKIKYFKELQEYTSLILKSSVSMEAIGKMISAIDYLKENMSYLVKEEYIEEIKEALKSFEEGLPLGDFYFVPRLRKISYLLLKKGYLKEEARADYERELEVWK